MKWLPMQQDSDQVVGGSVVWDRRKTWAFDNNHQLTSLQTVNGTKSFFKMTSKLYQQQATNVQVFEHASNRCIDAAKERRSWVPISRTSQTIIACS